MEFKGTKILALSKNKNQVLDDTKVLVIANVNDYGDFTHKYDALLFSKAPQLLEMVDELLKELAFHGYNHSTIIYQARELIIEATEL